jgi:hypothetical protein
MVGRHVGTPPVIACRGLTSPAASILAGTAGRGWRGIVWTMQEIKLIHDPDAEQEEWRVEDHDRDGDGGMARCHLRWTVR